MSRAAVVVVPPDTPLDLALVRLPLIGRAEEAMAIAEEAVTAARHHANPMWIAFALYGRGRAYVQADPLRALDSRREALAYTRTHRIPTFEATIARELAGLEADHGDIEHALDLFDFALDSFHHAGFLPQLVWVLARLARFFNHAERPEIAATPHGATTQHTTPA